MKRIKEKEELLCLNAFRERRVGFSVTNMPDLKGLPRSSEALTAAGVLDSIAAGTARPDPLFRLLRSAAKRASPSGELFEAEAAKPRKAKVLGEYEKYKTPTSGRTFSRTGTRSGSGRRESIKSRTRREETSTDPVGGRARFVGWLVTLGCVRFFMKRKGNR